MLGKLLPIVIAAVGLGAGVGAGIVLRPAPPALVDTMDDELTDKSDQKLTVPAASADKDNEEKASEFIALSNQFVFPLVDGGRVASLVVLSLTLEVAPEQTDAVYTREPKLRDGFLRVLFDHANTGGFDGAFTSNEAMGALRRALLEKGREELGDALYDVLILDINRQDT